MTLPRLVEAAIVAHARQAAPHECCGLLIGRLHEVVESWPASNIAADRTRQYRVDPRDHFAAIRDARRRALDVIGAYHSHPRSRPIPSATDGAEGVGEFIVLIVGLGVEPPELAAWTWAGGNFTALPIVRLS